MRSALKRSLRKRSASEILHLTLICAEGTTALTQIDGRRPGKSVANLLAAAGGVLFAFAAVAPAAMAQTNPAALVPQGSPLPRIAPVSPPNVSPPVAVPKSTPGALPNGNVEVTVRSVAVEGSTAYLPAQLAASTMGLEGQVKVAQIEQARQALLERYRRDGYLLTTVSANFDQGSGALRFVITEGRIADVKLSGDIGPAGVQVLRFLNHLKDLRPIDTASLERWLLLAQDVPGVSVRAVLRPSTEEPGALQLIASVSRTPYSGLFTADNRGAPYTGPEQVLGLLSLNSFTEYGEKTEFSLFHAFPNTQNFGQVATEVFLGGSGLKLRVYAGQGAADPSGALRAVGYHGVTQTLGIGLSYPLIRARQQTLSLGAYFDLLESNIHTGDPQVLASRDNLRVVRLGADYALQDLWLGGDRSAINSISVRLSQGLGILGASPMRDPLAGRLGERIEFTKVNFEATRTQTLLTFGTRNSVAVQGTLAGQYSPDVLPSAEKFFLGGARWNRGYYSGQVTGDSALSAALELQYNTGFATDVMGYPLDIGAQFYAFYDWGETWESQRQDANHRLYSAGGGVRLSLTKATEVDIEGVTRMTRQPQGAAANVAPLRAQALFWRVLTRF
jgi:hemolysin activation/secretion protein